MNDVQVDVDVHGVIEVCDVVKINDIVSHDEKIGIRITIKKSFMKEWVDVLTLPEFHNKIGMELSEQIFIAMMKNKIKL